MVSLYLKWVCLVVALSLFVAVATFLYLVSAYTTDMSAVAILFATVVVIVGVLYWFGRNAPVTAKLAKYVEDDSSDMFEFVQNLSMKKVALAIAISAGLGLLLELSIIRWQGTLFLVFAYYKNFSLLSCFAGLGIGYAASKQKQIPLLVMFPLVALQFLLLIFLRFSFGETLNSVLQIMPVSEQYHLHLSAAHSSAQFGIVYLFLSTVFLMTALTLMPVGQLCGALMEREKPLKAYGLNLLGSLLGVVLTFALSLFWTPPAVWFSVALVALIFFLSYKPRALLVGSISSLVAIGILSWPVSYLSEVVYSPYQKIERTCNYFGWMFIKAAGQYYQRVSDLSPGAVQAYPKLLVGAASYNLPYTVFGKKPESVAIMAAGTGNDVAAALRAGAGHVDAVEIDPAIIGFGKAYHPEHPYDNPNVHAVLDDARAFMRTSKNNYDVITYSALDSHSLLSHASSLRLDSYVYTVESFKEARSRLKPGGLLCMTFDGSAPELLAKIRLMMEAAFDGKAPACVQVKSASCAFLQTKEGDIKLPPTIFENVYYHDAGEETKKLSAENIDVSTDDWPFFYMYRRVYPFSYVAMFGMVALLTGLLATTFGSARVSKNNWSFALLGAGFMLIETKAITELSLAFSNTWYVVGIVIAAIMIMAFLANWTVSKLNIRNSTVPFVLLLISIAGGFYVAQSGWLPANNSDKILQIVVLTMPLFFSGMAFSILFGRTADMASAMAMNLLGAMLGGMLEYNAMYFGYRALYLIALGIYAIAFVLSFFERRKQSDAQVVVEPSAPVA